MNIDSYLSEDKNNNSYWMIFADLLALVLVFFILLYSTSNLDSEKWENINKSFVKTFNTDNIDKKDLVFTNNLEEKELNNLDNLNFIFNLIANKIQSSDELGENVQIIEQRNYVAIRLNDLDKLDTTVENRKIGNLYNILGGIKNHIDVMFYVKPDSANLVRFLELDSQIADQIRNASMKTIFVFDDNKDFSEDYLEFKIYYNS